MPSMAGFETFRTLNHVVKNDLDYIQWPLGALLSIYCTVRELPPRPRYPAPFLLPRFTSKLEQNISCSSSFRPNPHF